MVMGDVTSDKRSPLTVEAFSPYQPDEHPYAYFEPMTSPYKRIKTLYCNQTKLKEQGAKELLSGKIRQNIVTGVPSVRFDPAKKSVTLFMPGFDKSEIKLFQDIKELCDHTDSNVVITEDAQARKHFFYGDLCSRVYEWNVENAFREALSQIYHIVSRKALDAGDDPATLAKGQTINVGGKDDASAIKKVGCCST